MGAGDLRHQQTGQGGQHRKRKKQQRQRHPLERTVLRHRRSAAAGIEGERIRDQAALGSLQGAGQQAAALDRPKDAVQLPRGVGVQRGAGAGRKFRCSGSKKQHNTAGDPLADCVAQHDSRAAVACTPLRQQAQPRRCHRHPHKLLNKLRCDVGLHPPRRQKAPPHRPRHCHKRQARCQNQQRRLGTDVMQQIPRAGACQHGLRCHGRRAKAQRRAAQPAQRLRHTTAAGQTLGCQTRRGHMDARRGKGDEHHVKRQNQLVQPHPLTAEGRCHYDPEPHAQQPQHQPRPGKQRRIVQIIPAVVHTPPPSPADGYAEGAAGIPAREAFPLGGRWPQAG